MFISIKLGIALYTKYEIDFFSLTLECNFIFLQRIGERHTIEVSHQRVFFKYHLLYGVHKRELETLTVQNQRALTQMN